MNRYSDELRSQVIKEFSEVKSYSLLAEKHNIPESTIYYWVRPSKPVNKAKEHFASTENKDLKKKLYESELENQILRELLKKTYQVVDIEKK